MNKDEKYDELVGFLREFDLYSRNVVNSGSNATKVVDDTANAIFTTILRKVRDLDKK